MRRIVRAEAVCLRVHDYHESSKLVTFFTPDRGRLSCLAKGARRLKSKFGAALDLFAQSRIIYYSHDTRTLLTLSDAELVRSFSRIALEPDRFLAAEQMAEFVLRVIQPLDPSPQLYQLLVNYLSILESCSPAPADLQHPPADSPDPNPYPALVCSFLLKAASFLGFRPELRRCVICRRPTEGPRPSYFDAGRGGIVCARCAGERGDQTDAPQSPFANRHSPFAAMTRLDAASLDTLCFLLYTPASEIAQLSCAGPHPAGPLTGLLTSSPLASLQSQFPALELVLNFLGHHFDPLVLNSFRWHAALERNT